MPGWTWAERLASLVSFLTILPSPRRDLVLASEALWASPLIGLIVAVISLASLWIVGLVDAWLGAFTFTTLAYMLSGLLHLDGFIDFADVLSTGARGEEAYRILKDPHKGGKGIAYTILLVISVYLVYTRLAELSPVAASVAIVATYEALYLTGAMGDPPPYQGLGRLFIVNSRGRLGLNLAAYVLAQLPLIITGGLEALVAALGTTAAVLAASAYTVSRARRSLGWVNGDVLGFSLELARCLAGYTALLLVMVFR